MAKRRAKVGDILTVQTPQRAIHLQYIGRHKQYGDMIYVLEPFDDGASRGYLAFYPASAALRKDMVTVTGHMPIPPDLSWKKIRRAGARSFTDGRILSWIIDDDGNETVVKTLSNADRGLPIAATWSHDLMIMRILSGWRPEDEV